MRQVTIKELGKRLSIEMANLPFAVTRYGRVIGVMTEEGTDLSTESTDLITKGTDNQGKNNIKGTDNTSKADKPIKITARNDKAKSTSPIDPGFFNLQPKQGKVKNSHRQKKRIVNSKRSRGMP